MTFKICWSGANSKIVNGRFLFDIESETILFLKCGKILLKLWLFICQPIPRPILIVWNVSHRWTMRFSFLFRFMTLQRKIFCERPFVLSKMKSFNVFRLLKSTKNHFVNWTTFVARTRNFDFASKNFLLTFSFFQKSFNETDRILRRRKKNRHDAGFDWFNVILLVQFSMKWSCLLRNVDSCF